MSELVYTPDNLFAGDGADVVTETANLKGSQGILPRGTVLGCLTADNTKVILDTTKTTGAEKPYAILAETTDTGTSDPVPAPVYLAGQFNLENLGISGSAVGTISPATLVAMRDVSLFTRPVGVRS